MGKTEMERGFTISELIVGMFLFSVVSMGMATFMHQTFQRTGLEARASHASQELQNAVALIKNELQMSAVVSPYLPGTLPENVDCSAATTATANALQFLVTHDDDTASNGIAAYYVGYTYDESSRELRRGEVTKPITTNCILPAGSPTSSSNAQTIAKRIVRIDSNGDGTPEPVFQLTNGVLTLNIGTEIEAPNGETITQQISTTIAARKR